MLRVAAMAAVIGLAGSVSATSAFAEMNGPWDQPASFARVGRPGLSGITGQLVGLSVGQRLPTDRGARAR